MPSSIERIGYLSTHVRPELDHLFRRLLALVGFLEDVFVLVFVVELAGSGIERDADLLARLVACFVIASIRTSSASSFDFRFGANPPSSPTAVE